MGRPTEDDVHYLLTALVLVAEAAPSESFRRDRALEHIKRMAAPFNVTTEALTEVFDMLLTCSPRWSSSLGSASSDVHEVASKAIYRLTEANIAAHNVGRILRRFIGLTARAVDDDERWSTKGSYADAIFITGIAAYDYRSKIKK